jgi:hypothetical protein
MSDRSRRIALRLVLALIIPTLILLGACVGNAWAGTKVPAKVTRWKPEIERIFTAHDITLGYTARTLRCIHRESHGGTQANPRRKYWGLIQIDRRWSFPPDTDGSRQEVGHTNHERWQGCGSCSLHAMAHKIRTEGVRRTQGRWRTWR